jgi:hypothetical protein
MDALLIGLQHEADAYVANATELSSWSVSILNRLNDYVAIVVPPLKLRIRSVSLQLVTPQRIEVRVAGTTQLLVVFAPGELLVAEIAFLRQCAHKKLTTPQLITADVSYNVIPVGVMVCTHCAGNPLCEVADETMYRVGARQVGRLLRTLHTQTMPGWGAPTMLNTWDSANWRDVLKQWMQQYTPLLEFTSPAMQTANFRIWHELINDDYLRSITPVCIHGALACSNVYVTLHSHVQLEGLVRPSPIVAGDAMFDLASVMRSAMPLPFRQGIIEGYTASMPLRSDEVLRVKRLSVLWRVYDLLIYPEVNEVTLASSTHAALDALLA